MKQKILIADDEPYARDVLQVILEEEGYEVVLAESGKQALAIAETLPIDGFILDIEMPGMTGIDVCRAVRNIQQYRGTPIIFLTGRGDDSLSDAFSAGGDDFISKPYTAATVRARLKGHL